MHILNPNAGELQSSIYRYKHWRQYLYIDTHIQLHSKISNFLLWYVPIVIDHDIDTNYHTEKKRYYTYPTTINNALNSHCNMADEDDDTSESRSDVFGIYIGIIDQRIERFLWQLTDEPKKDVASELVGELDLETLRIARDKVFERARVKAQKSTYNGVVCTAKNNPPIALDDRHTDPWRLRKRRQINLIIVDVCDVHYELVHSIPEQNAET